MSFPQVRIVRGQGALGRPRAAQDYVSGLIFYSDVLPSGFSTTPDNIKEILSVSAAEALGILNDYSDETRGKGTILLTAPGTAGDTITAKFTEPNGTVVTLGSYKVVTSDTDDLIAAGLRASISANSANTGYSATSSTATVTITFRKGLGIYPNSGTPLSADIVQSGGLAATVTQSTVDGVASRLIQWYYHISEYYRLNPQGKLFVLFAPVTAQAWDYDEIIQIQTYAKGAIRQVGLYLYDDIDSVGVSEINTIFNAIQVKCAALDTLHAPLSAIFTADLTSVDNTELATFPDLNLLSDYKVSMSIGQDGNNLGAAIFAAQGRSIGDIGAQLGALSFVAVNQDQGCLAYVNFTDGKELSVPCFGNGNEVNLIKDVNLANQLNGYRYIYLMQNIGFEGSGTTINDNHCGVSVSNDYAYQNDNRTFDKIARLLYNQFVPILKSTIKLNEDGTITDVSLAYYKTQISAALNGMLTSDPVTGNQELAGEIPTIDPTQNVLSTGNLVIAVKATPEGVARNIIIGVTL